MEIVFGVVAGLLGFLFCYCLLGGLYTINQNERAVVTNFGRAERIGDRTNLDLPIAECMRPEEKERYVYPQIRVIAPPGGALLFSAAQMHSSVPNNSGRTRFSIDFRTVNVDDVATRRGAPNVDSACTGTTMGDYLRGTDLTHLPEKYFEMYETQPPIAKREELETATKA